MTFTGAIGRREVLDPIEMIRPPRPAGIRCGIAARQHRYVPFRVTSITSSHSASGTS